MLPALRLRPRASCLTWRRVEQQHTHGLLQPFRQASNGQPWTKKAKREKPTDQGSEGQKNNHGLLEELFPEEAQRHGPPRALEREVPRLTLDIPEVPDVLTATLPDHQRKSRHGPELPLDRAAYWSTHRDTKKQYTHLEKQGEFISVLVLSNASKDLTEEDFRRVIPQGKHLEGWNLERGDIMKVIPGRDTTTLERLNFYFILFESPVSAFAYQTHVTRLHKLSQIHTPSSLMSPIPPPPGYLMQGEDIQSMIQSYSLLPPSQEMRIRQLSPPLSPSLQQIVKYRGYPSIVKRVDEGPVKVLLRLEGPQLPIPIIKSALSKAARDRGLPWTGDETHDLTVRRWEVRGSNVSPMSQRRLHEAEEDSGEADGVEEELPRISKEKGPVRYQRERRQAPPSCIIGFQDEAEAETFVRYWHRRPMELANYDYDGGDVAPIVNAEILW